MSSRTVGPYNTDKTLSQQEREKWRGKRKVEKKIERKKRVNIIPI